LDNTFLGNDNQNYILSPLTLGDNKRFTKFVRYRRWEQFQELKDQLPADEFSKESGRILQECNSLDIHEGSDEVKRLENTLEGMAYFVYLSVRHSRSDVTVSQIEEALTGQNLPEIFRKLLVVSGIIAKKNDAPSAEKKNSSEASVATADTESTPSTSESTTASITEKDLS
jgi:hypothetical protein